MDIYYLDINHYWTCIIWTYTTNGHRLLGHKPLYDIYYLDMDHCQTYFIMMNMNLIMMNMNHEPQLDMDYWTHPIVGHMTFN